MVGKFETRRCGEFMFASRYWETSRAWGHECYLLRDYGEVGKARYRYYNRTWEAYKFQSVMYGALEDYAEQELKRFLNDKKIVLGLKGWDSEQGEFEKPFKRGEKAKYIEEFKKSKSSKDIERLRKFIKGE